MEFYLKLIRPINLLLTAFAMYCVRWLIIIPVLNNCKVDTGHLAPFLNEGWFLLLLISVVLINAAGYVINDFCDVETDKINKPEKIIIPEKISYKQASTFYYLLNIIGIAIAAVVAFHINSLRLGSIHLLAIGLLWIYAMQLKKIALVGNLSVAILAATVLLIPVLFEPIVFNNLEETFKVQVSVILSSTLVFAAFAFLTQMIREIIKDLQDIEGDKATGCKTLPIMTSTSVTKSVILFFILITMIGAAWFQIRFFSLREAYPLFNTWNIFTSIGIQLPLLFVGIKIWKANDAAKLKVLSTAMKVVMFIGVCSMLFIQQWFQSSTN